ncbi:hypothetical protein B9Y60_10580 [Stenotrophomonas maltophilia]|uniref:hypothetical protein n=1 Tax=Stenotrophomonas maltophilia TaxID=40324 RepID=UPI000C2641A0|nr:hypothetical protein [Stenotrophomonas maltophilia]PJL52200.1 hypothetical protein B9Y73_10580 [Stenotrophomonas maltophilia]PJL55121.1 hypothetical protein B9Y60_10580 [Stenotrophomonas maltophilia]
MKWMLTLALFAASGSALSAEPLNGMQCGYYTQESQSEDLGAVLHQVVDNLGVRLAVTIQQDGQKRGRDPTSQMKYLLERYRTVILPAQQATIEGFIINARMENSDIKFLKSLCKKPDTYLEDIMGDVFYKSIERLSRNEN